jgi:hypothetical protein
VTARHVSFIDLVALMDKADRPMRIALVPEHLQVVHLGQVRVAGECSSWNAAAHGGWASAAPRKGRGNRSPERFIAWVEGWSRFFVEAVSPAPGNIARPNLQFLDAPCCPCRFREGYREESWIARIFWELYKEKPAPVLPGIDPGLYGFDDLAAAIPGPGVGPPLNICAYQTALTALYGGDPRVGEIYYRNLVAVDQGGRCGDVPGDRDHDGVPDGADNCPFVANHDQEDADHDSIGDACDGCSLPDPSGTDLDYDGVGDRCEGPPAVSVTATPSSGAAPLEVSLSGSAVDIGGTITSWTWEVGGPPPRKPAG